jgi:hypothetical protein
MRFPWANVALLVLVALQLVTGLAGLLGASDPFRFLFWIHAVGAYAIVVVLFAKAMIIVDVVRRRPGFSSERALLALMILLLVAVLASGLVWITSGPRVIAGYSLINLHAFMAITLAMLLTAHVLDRRWIVRVPASHDRRAFLRFAGLAVVGVALWQIERPLQRLLELPGARRRFTGSYERGSFSTEFPEVSWFNDDPDPIDGGSWRLAVEGAVAHPLDLRYADLEKLPHSSQVALLDCTGGWFARQQWTGVPLAALLDAAELEGGAESVSVESVTGYGRRFSVEHARELLLATHVAGTPLAHGHGFPARLVVPDRRGFDWVKWVVRIRVLRSSSLLQPPLPLS